MVSHFLGIKFGEPNTLQQLGYKISLGLEIYFFFLLELLSN